MLICVHPNEQRSKMTVGAHAVNKPMRTNRTESSSRASCTNRHMSTSPSHPSNGKSSWLGTVASSTEQALSSFRTQPPSDSASLPRQVTISVPKRARSARMRPSRPQRLCVSVKR